MTRMAAVATVAAQLVFVSVAGAEDATLETRLDFRNGRIAVDENQTTILLGEREKYLFDACGIGRDDLKRALVGYLDRSLGRRPTAIEQIAAFDRPEDHGKKALADLGARAHEDKATAGLFRLTTDWKDGTARLARWRALAGSASSDGGDAAIILYAGLMRDPMWMDGPLALDAPDATADQRPSGASDGRIVFRILPPFLAGEHHIPAVNVEEWRAARGTVPGTLLSPFECRLCDGDAVSVYLADYLKVRGIPFPIYRGEAPGSGAGPAPAAPEKARAVLQRPSFSRGDPSTEVQVDPDPLIDHVFIEADPTTDWPIIRQVVYALTSTADWRRIARDPALQLCTMSVTWKPALESSPRPMTVTRLSFSGLNPGGAYISPALLADRMQDQLPTGYSIVTDFLRADGRRKSISLRIVSSAASSERKRLSDGGPTLPACAPPADEPAGGHSSGQTHDGSANDEPGGARPLEDPDRNAFFMNSEQIAGKSNQQSVGLSRSGILDANDSVAAVVRMQGKESGRLEYQRDFVGFGALARRVQMGIAVFSEFDPDRSAFGMNADERRDGGELRASVDLWRDYRGTTAQLDLGVSRSSVRISGIESLHSNITLLETALSLARSQDGTAASFHRDVRMSFAQGQANSQQSFSKAGVDVHAQRFIGDFARINLTGLLRYASDGTPLTERPSFGGADSVRGYLDDFAVGRSTLALQNELLLPMDALARSSVVAKSFLRRDMAFAIFGDVGHVDRAIGSVPSGVKASIGVGVRLAMGDKLLLRLDWAMAVGPDSHRASDLGYVYLSVTSRRGF